MSGDDVARALAHFGFSKVSQRGSHAKLRRVTSEGENQTLHIPMHGELRTGTLHAIFRQACQFVDESQLRPHFYSEK